MFKILQARLQQYVNREVPDVQAGFRKSNESTGKDCQNQLSQNYGCELKAYGNAESILKMAKSQ